MCRPTALPTLHAAVTGLASAIPKDIIGKTGNVVQKKHEEEQLTNSPALSLASCLLFWVKVSLFVSMWIARSLPTPSGDGAVRMKLLALGVATCHVPHGFKKGKKVSNSGGRGHHRLENEVPESRG